MQPVEPSKCNNLCDPIAQCACHLVYAHYWCLCPEGFEGSGRVGQCHSKFTSNSISLGNTRASPRGVGWGRNCFIRWGPWEASQFLSPRPLKVWKNLLEISLIIPLLRFPFTCYFLGVEGRLQTALHATAKLLGRALPLTRVPYLPQMDPGEAPWGSQKP